MDNQASKEMFYQQIVATNSEAMRGVGGAIKDLSAAHTASYAGLEAALSKLNDTNVLHMEVLRANTSAIDNIQKFWGRLLMMLAGAVVMLAGAEKILTIFK